MTFFEELQWRGLVKDISSPDLIEKLNKGGMTFYLGTDPTADSLHLGHLSPFLLSKRLKDAGHRSILLVGGATGKIGDPRPSAERNIIPDEIFVKNKEGIRKQVAKLFGCDEVVDNWDWSKDINFIDYLRDYGKYFPIGYMLQKDTVRRRLDVGITYTEFSYMIMQALDFLWLHENKNVNLQIGGSDQWGNITAGVDLIRRKKEEEVYALCMPLVLDKNGNKFGKSEGNALWLDKEKTTSFEMYQHLINTDDELVISYLKIFTFLSKEEIDALEKEMKEKPELRNAQKALGREVLIFLYGKDEYDNVIKSSESLFKDDITSLTADEIISRMKDVPKFDLRCPINIVDMLVENNICISKREAREMIGAGAIIINNEKIIDLDYVLSNDMAIEEKLVVIRKGKKKYYLGMIK